MLLNYGLKQRERRVQLRTKVFGSTITSMSLKLPNTPLLSGCLLTLKNLISGGKNMESSRLSILMQSEWQKSINKLRLA